MREQVATDKYEYRATRDVRVPLVEGDDEFSCGWQNVSVTPTPDASWEVWDSSGDKKTVWRRLRSPF
jgi:hypothetical protein